MNLHRKGGKQKANTNVKPHKKKRREGRKKNHQVRRAMRHQTNERCERSGGKPIFHNSRKQSLFPFLPFFFLPLSHSTFSTAVGPHLRKPRNGRDEFARVGMNRKDGEDGIRQLWARPEILDEVAEREKATGALSSKISPARKTVPLPPAFSIRLRGFIRKRTYMRCIP